MGRFAEFFFVLMMFFGVWAMFADPPPLWAFGMAMTVIGVFGWDVNRGR